MGFSRELADVGPDVGRVEVGLDDMLAGTPNLVLNALPPADLTVLARNARRSTYNRGQTIAAADHKLDLAFFVETGVASLLTPRSRGRPVELCLMGPSTFIGSPIITADGRWPWDVNAQMDEVQVVSVPAADLRAVCARSEVARAVLLSQSHLQLVQVAENLFALASQSVLARVSRWILMYRDQLATDRIAITHEYLAMMVGAQRTKVTSALHVLESVGAIHSVRGCVIVRDPGQLRDHADGGYGIAEAEVRRLAGWSPQPFPELTPAANGGARR